MFGSFILDVAIGMVFIYLLLSLVASGVNEILASIIQSRAANLERGLRSLLSGDSIAGGGLVDLLYGHGLIRGLYPDPAKDLGNNSGPNWWSRRRLWLQRFVGMAPGKAIAAINNPLLLPSYIPARTFAMAMIDILSKNPIAGKAPLESIEQLLATAAADPQNKAAEALLTLVNDAKNDVQKTGEQLQRFQKNLEDWYNDAMDRVSGWYKLYTQKVLLIVGLILAIVFNVNSISIAHLLWVDRDIRDGMVSAATDYLKQHPDAPVSAKTQNGAQAQTGAQAQNETQTQTGAQSQSGVQAQNGADQSISEQALIARMESSVKAVDAVTTKYMLPVGWRYTPSEYLTWWQKNTCDMLLRALIVLVGWLITAGALSLGASFWFDMLNKIMVIRNTVKPQEKSPAEGSKD
jgi:hypothetical protein